MAVPSVKQFVTAIFLLSCLVPTSTAGSCTTVLTAAKAAYDSQVDLMRRGLTAETSTALFAEFIANLAAKAWETGPMGAAFGDICIPQLYLDQLQNENGTLLASAAIESDVEDSSAKVPLMTKEELAGLALSFPPSQIDSEWTLTSAYLMEDIPLVINVSRLILPNEGAIRVDPYKEDACFQFEQRYSTTGLSTLTADVWTSHVLSLVLNLIDMGANATKAMQLLKHSTAYTNMGIRCYGTEGSQLPIPMVFLTQYARQSAWLSQNNSVVLRKDLTATNLQYANREIVGLMSSFSSGGRLPETVIAANGQLKNMNFNWTSSTDADKTFRETKECLPEREDYYKTVESSINAAISAVIANENDLAFSISRTVKEQKPFWPISNLGNRLGEATESIKSALKATRALLSTPDEESPAYRVVLPTTVRQSCGAGWDFFDRPGVTEWTEQCCATICISAVASLGPPIAAMFTESCCDACNEYVCAGGEQAAVEGAATTVGVELPPYGQIGNESIPVMI